MRSCTRTNVFGVFENSFATTCCAVVLVVVLNIFFTKHVFGQGAGFGAQAVGGISVDTDGIVRTINPQALESIAAQRKKILSETFCSSQRRPVCGGFSLRIFFR